MRVHNSAWVCVIAGCTVAALSLGCSDVSGAKAGKAGTDAISFLDGAPSFGTKDAVVPKDVAVGKDAAALADAAADIALASDAAAVDVAVQADLGALVDVAQSDAEVLDVAPADVPVLTDVVLTDAAPLKDQVTVPDIAVVDVAAVDVQPDIPFVAALGCIKPSQAADGFVDLLLGPSPAALSGLWGVQATLQLTVQGIDAGGASSNLSGATWDVDPPGAGSIDASGLFTAAGTFGGPVTLSAHYKTLCKSMPLQMKVLWIDKTSEPSPGIGAVLAVTPATDAPTGISLLYPPSGTLAPMDFSPITAQWTYGAALTANTFVLRFESDAAQIDIVGGANWKQAKGYAVTIPTASWQKLFAFSSVKTWNLRVIAASTNAKVVSGTPIQSPAQPFSVAQQKAGGAIYYWNTSMLGVRVLEPGKAPASIPTPGGFCAGCHSISPDGSTIAVSFMMGAGGGSMSMGLFTAKSGLNPPWLHANAKAALAKSFTIAAAFSKKYFSATDKRLVVPSAPLLFSTNLYAVDLIKGTSNILVTGGDLGQQAFPTWSPDGSTVVYASAKNVGQGFAASEPTMLYSVPYNGGAGGKATALAGVNDPGMYHFYPSFTVDSQWVAYNRATTTAALCPQNAGGTTNPNGGPGSADSGTYDNCEADLWITKPSGGSPIRLDAANGQAGAGLTNSWPTFATVGVLPPGGYYWMAFSSRRDYGFLHTGAPASPQIWIAAIDPLALAQGKDGSFAALWLPGQDINAGCHIARWADTPRD